jgi:hypothetical protein
MSLALGEEIPLHVRVTSSNASIVVQIMNRVRYSDYGYLPATSIWEGVACIDWALLGVRNEERKIHRKNSERKED